MLVFTGGKCSLYFGKKEMKTQRGGILYPITQHHPAAHSEGVI